VRIEEMKFSKNYLKCSAILGVACSKYDLITLEKLEESD
jgi:hypothetical protein